MLRISKGGNLYYRHYENNRWKNVTENLSGFLTLNPNNVCDIDEDATLNDIFKLIKKNRDMLINILHPRLDDFLNEIRKRSTNSCNDCDYLEIYWGPILDNWSDNKEPDILYDGSHIHLVKDIKEPTGDPDEDFSYYGIMYAQLNDLKHFPVKLNKTYNIQRFGKKKKLVKATKEFYLMEILSCMIWDFTWFGGPDGRKKHLKELDKSIEELQ